MPTRRNTKIAPAEVSGRAVIYCRISQDTTGEQAGVVRQEKDCRDYCRRQGLEIVAVKIDNDISASSYSRKVRVAYRETLDLFDTGQADTLVAWHIDRLYRQPKELEALIDRAETGITVRTLYGEYDMSNSDGRAMARVGVAFAAKSSDDTSRRLRRQKQERRTEGRLTNAGRIYGWLDETTQQPAEAKVIRQLFRRYLRGESFVVIANAMNDRGVPTPAACLGRSSMGKWWASVVRNQLINPRHAGLVHTRRTGELEIVGESKADPIVSRVDFERAQALIATRGMRVRGIPRRSSLLTRLVHCSECGARMVRGQDRGRPTWRCIKHPGRVGCGRLSIDANLIESLVTDAVLDWSDNPELRQMIGESRTNGNDDSQVADIVAELAELEHTSESLAKRVALNKLPVNDYERVMRHIDSQRDELNARLAVTAKSSSPLLLKKGAIRTGWERMNVHQRRDVIEAFLDAADVDIFVKPATKGRQNIKGGDPDRVEIRARHDRGKVA